MMSVFTFCFAADHEPIVNAPEKRNEIERIETSEITDTSISAFNRMGNEEHLPISDLTFEIDEDNLEGEPDDNGMATWLEVFGSCFDHSNSKCAIICLNLSILMILIYGFSLGIFLIAQSAKVVSVCALRSFFLSEINSIEALSTGILVTVILQSSTTTTHIVIQLVGRGMLPVQTAIYITMGANFGATVTNTIIALAHMGDRNELQRAFTGATIYDMFNLLTLIIIFPIEIMTGYLSHSAQGLSQLFKQREGLRGPFVPFLTALVQPVGEKIIIPNRLIFNAISKNESCDKFYPVSCLNNKVSFETCETGIISCSATTHNCPYFFDRDTTLTKDQISGVVCLFLAIVLVLISLTGTVGILRRMLGNTSIPVINRVNRVNPYIIGIMGFIVSLYMEGPTVPLSLLSSLVGIGVIKIEFIYSFCVGGNFAPPIAALWDARAVEKTTDAVQVALAHLLFNTMGFLLWFPFLHMRHVLIKFNNSLGSLTQHWNLFPVFYIFTAFIIIPLITLYAGFLIERFGVLLGIIVFVVIFSGMVTFVHWYFFLDGSPKLQLWLSRRREKKLTESTLHSDIEYLKNEIVRIKKKIDIADEEENNVMNKMTEPPRTKPISLLCYKFESWSFKRKKRRLAMQTLPEDMKYFKSEVEFLKHHVNILDEENYGINGRNF